VGPVNPVLPIPVPIGVQTPEFPTHKDVVVVSYAIAPLIGGNVHEFGTVKLTPIGGINFLEAIIFSLSAILLIAKYN
jgi:hypothetical protein